MSISKMDWGKIVSLVRKSLLGQGAIIGQPGPKGDIGPQGPKGDRGEVGPAGIDGKSINVIKASNETAAIELSNANPNNIYFWE